MNFVVDPLTRSQSLVNPLKVIYAISVKMGYALSQFLHLICKFLSLLLCFNSCRFLLWLCLQYFHSYQGISQIGHIDCHLWARRVPLYILCTHFMGYPSILPFILHLVCYAVFLFRLISHIPYAETQSMEYAGFASLLSVNNSNQRFYLLHLLPLLCYFASLPKM